MKVKELVSKCDMNCTVELISSEGGYLFKFGVGEFKSTVDTDDIFVNVAPATTLENAIIKYFSYIGLAEQDVKDFHIKHESGYVFPVIEIYI